MSARNFFLTAVWPSFRLRLGSHQDSVRALFTNGLDVIMKHQHRLSCGLTPRISGTHGCWMIKFKLICASAVCP
jgi:hypothetical protein